MKPASVDDMGRNVFKLYTRDEKNAKEKATIMGEEAGIH